MKIEYDLPEDLKLNKATHKIRSGQVINIEKDEARQEARKKALIKDYQFNPYPNRKARRMEARLMGYLTNGWQMYRAPVGSNVQTVNKQIVKKSDGYIKSLAELQRK